jgi:hypothetical protein
MMCVWSVSTFAEISKVTGGARVCRYKTAARKIQERKAQLDRPTMDDDEDSN